MLHTGACRFRITALPHRQSAITHSGVAGFRLATFTDLKAEVFLSQLNLTEVSKVNNKKRHAVLKSSGPTQKKKSYNHKSTERNEVEHVFHPHQRELLLLNPSATFQSSDTSWFSCGNHAELYSTPLWSSRLNKLDKCWLNPIKQTLLPRCKVKWEFDLCHNLFYSGSESSQIIAFTSGRVISARNAAPTLMTMYHDQHVFQTARTFSALWLTLWWPGIHLDSKSHRWRQSHPSSHPRRGKKEKKPLWRQPLKLVFATDTVTWGDSPQGSLVNEMSVP